MSGRGTRYVLLISCVAATGGFLFGYDTAVINGTVGALERHFSADPGRLGFAVAAALLGSAVGAVIAGRVADRAGRVRAMRLTALLFATSSLGSGIAQSLSAFSAWRFLGGIAVGAASVIAPAYILTLGTMTWLFTRAPLDPHGSPVLTGADGTAALVAANLYVFAFGFSWGPIVWVLLGEMFNNRIRGAALALAASAQWVANWLVTLTFPGLSKMGLGVAYGLYTAAAAVSIVLVARLVRETKGRALEEM
jgi:MFS family permease